MIKLNTQTLVLSSPEPGVAQIQLHRPEVFNAINTEMLCGLGEALNYLESEQNIKCVVLTGDEKAFAAGADVSELLKVKQGTYPEQERSQAWDRIRSFSKPIIAAVNGYAFGGGCELVQHADIVLASNTAQFAQPEIKLGVMPGAGGTQYLPARVGKATAMLMNLTGMKIDGQRALEIGLISEYVDEADALPAAIKIAKRMSKSSSSALQAIKKSVLNSYEYGPSDGLTRERALFLQQVASDDGVEGISAYLDKREPKFN